ncbi:hypothetical protein ACFL4T_02015 [candidate division KSB1 bacterium]
MTEYKRAWFYLSDKPEKDTVLLKIALCEKGREAYENAHNILEELQKGSSLLKNPAFKQNAYIYYISGKFNKSLYLIRDKDEYHLRLLSSWNHIRLKQWQYARTTLKNLLELNKQTGKQLYDLYADLDKNNIPVRKKPFISALFSAVIPGLGKVYCGRYSDGIYSFLVNGIFIYAAVNSHNHGYKTRTAVLTGAASVFYLGNVYGSYLAANVVNRENEDNFIQHLENKYHHNLTNLFSIQF